MIKKLLIAVAFLAAVLPSGFVRAQFNVGDWTLHSVFLQEQKTVVDSKSGVYFVADGNLFRYDKNTAEITACSKRNMLNDNEVTDIYYNQYNGCVVVAYSSSNIDLILPDGDVVNFPDVADMSLTTSRAINDVAFVGKDAYIATDFGYLVLDCDACKIIEANVYYTAVNSVTKVGGKILLNVGDKLYAAPSDASHAAVSKFAECAGAEGSGTLTTIDDKSVFFSTVAALNVVSVTGDATLAVNASYGSPVDNVQPSVNGFVATDKRNARLVLLDKAGTVLSQTVLGGDMANSMFCASSTDASVLWELGRKGVRKVRIDGSQLAAEGGYIAPVASSVKRVGKLYYNKALDDLYVMTGGPSIYTAQNNIPAYINALKNGSWTDMTPTDVPTNSGSKVLCDMMSPVFDPDDPSTFYCGTWYEGVYKITGNKVVAHYDWNNSPMVQLWAWCDLVMGVQMDANKNLWVIEYTDTGNIVAVLPRNKQNKTNVTAADWITVNVTLPGSTDYRTQFLIAQKSNMKITVTSRFDSELMIIDDGGNPAGGNIRTRKFTSFIDQDNNSYDATYHYCLFEDNDGMVWLGTSDGVIRFDPAKAFSDDFRVERMKVQSGSASDYLLAGKDVSCIAADASGVKWIGTLTSGIYQVSADGTRIINHFNTGNSLLKSDRILSIACKPDGSTIYAGTENGLVEYTTGIIPGEMDFSKVAVSPMNISADYTGDVTVEHLMSGSTVTIADADGNAVAKVAADGGVAIWNLLDAVGKRVPTGKYTIYASLSAASRGEKVASVNVCR